ncbi:hypothetical protein QBC40DRAFT_326804 [Triangularia verruculosa]|uniref:Uncharacterized protein n=1 Tax=Triangularia verruculosa TaxID=2587418 RepID=A0AAN6XH39_9PEZI|nr:hypothetical protein QBC40DRAFT_326804 [Triangularia verruculosa]
MKMSHCISDIHPQTLKVGNSSATACLLIVIGFCFSLRPAVTTGWTYLTWSFPILHSVTVTSTWWWCTRQSQGAGPNDLDDLLAHVRLVELIRDRAESARQTKRGRICMFYSASRHSTDVDAAVSHRRPHEKVAEPVVRSLTVKGDDGIPSVCWQWPALGTRTGIPTRPALLEFRACAMGCIFCRKAQRFRTTLGPVKAGHVRPPCSVARYKAGSIRQAKPNCAARPMPNGLRSFRGPESSRMDQPSYDNITKLLETTLCHGSVMSRGGGDNKSQARAVTFPVMLGTSAVALPPSASTRRSGGKTLIFQKRSAFKRIGFTSCANKWTARWTPSR